MYDYFVKRYNMDLQAEEDWIMKSASLKKSNVNLTDMSQEELLELDRECKSLLKNHRRLIRKVRHIIDKYTLRGIPADREEVSR